MESKERLTPLLHQLKKNLNGDLHFDSLMRTLYATDASVYSQLPLAVAFPKNTADIKKLMAFAKKHKTSLIPRAAGTSLAGQCVGDGIVVDVKHFNKILEFNPQEGWIIVEPGIIRNELNAFLKPYGYFFSPITSTANRAMIGGMIGNNSCGTTSIEYGSTREHVLELKTILADGSEVTFKAIDSETFQKKRTLPTLEGQLYEHIYQELSNKEQQNAIRNHFPKPSIQRRNTGYAVDYLLESDVFTENKEQFNFCKLLCGSEGTLAFTTAVKLDLDPVPKPYDVVVAAHFMTVHDSMKASQYAMQHAPSACELMDKIILDCTIDNIEQSKNRFFIQGDPKAVLMVEFRGDTLEEADLKADILINDLKSKKIGYAFPKVHSPQTKGLWSLRSAGLGLLANIPGDKKAVACIEDTAVALEDLADYIDEFEQIMNNFDQEAVFYAHAGAGEIHLRPILNLKEAKDVENFYKISEASAKLVKKYKGSLSGEHGDGRLRAAFIPMMVGNKNYELFKRIKTAWDTDNVLNPGKIVNAAPMNSSLRYAPNHKEKTIETLMDFSSTGGILRLTEKCNGSGDCRKLPLSGGTMCPSYQATRNEKDTTRARANTLRTFLTKSTLSNPFDHQEIKEVMDLCISCKGCSSECPSNIDMSSLKAEFQYQYYKTHTTPLRAKVFANINKINRLNALLPSFSNFFLANKYTSSFIKRILKIAPQRSLPLLHKTTLYQWFRHQNLKLIDKPIKTVYLFCDEFTNYNDTIIGIKSIQLLHRLGYEVKMIAHEESGRAAISKGILKTAQHYAQCNVDILKNIITQETPLLGIEPSAILSFRDEYPRLVAEKDRQTAKSLSENVFMIDEFIAQEFQKGNIKSNAFTTEVKQILLHGHCHQKALSSVDYTAWILSIPKNYNVQIIPSGCCGMAGSFGYEKEHYEISNKIGAMVLFPAINQTPIETIIAASGTSCRHQIKDNTGRIALHPIELLWNALVE